MLCYSTSGKLGYQKRIKYQLFMVCSPNKVLYTILCTWPPIILILRIHKHFLIFIYGWRCQCQLLDDIKQNNFLNVRFILWITLMTLTPNYKYQTLEGRCILTATSFPFQLLFSCSYHRSWLLITWSESRFQYRSIFEEDRCVEMTHCDPYHGITSSRYEASLYPSLS